MRVHCIFPFTNGTWFGDIFNRTHACPHDAQARYTRCRGRTRNERKGAREGKDVKHDNRRFIAVFAILGIRFSTGGSACLKTRLYSRRLFVMN